jgi:hypothetical protein
MLELAFASLSKKIRANFVLFKGQNLSYRVESKRKLFTFRAELVGTVLRRKSG